MSSLSPKESFDAQARQQAKDENNLHIAQDLREHPLENTPKVFQRESFLVTPEQLTQLISWLVKTYGVTPDFAGQSVAQLTALIKRRITKWLHYDEYGYGAVPFMFQGLTLTITDNLQKEPHRQFLVEIKNDAFKLAVQEKFAFPIRDVKEYTLEATLPWGMPKDNPDAPSVEKLYSILLQRGYISRERYPSIGSFMARLVPEPKYKKYYEHEHLELHLELNDQLGYPFMLKVSLTETADPLQAKIRLTLSNYYALAGRLPRLPLRMMKPNNEPLAFWLNLNQICSLDGCLTLKSLADRQTPSNRLFLLSTDLNRPDYRVLYGSQLTS